MQIKFREADRFRHPRHPFISLNDQVERLTRFLALEEAGGVYFPFFDMTSCDPLQNIGRFVGGVALFD